MPPPQDRRGDSSKLLLLPVGLAVVCCGLPALIGVGLLGVAGGWLGAHGAWLAAGVVLAVAVVLVARRRVSQRRCSVDERTEVTR